MLSVKPQKDNDEVLEMQKIQQKQYNVKFACTKKNVRCTSTRKETERKTENQVERMYLKKKRYGKCGVKEVDALDRTKWKNDIHNHSGDPRWWEKLDEKKNTKYKTVLHAHTLPIMLSKLVNTNCQVKIIWQYY